MVDNARTQGTRISGNNWSVTVHPTNSTTVHIYANNANNTNGAARISIPVNIAAATPLTPSVVIPPAPPNLGPVAIASITETPSIGHGYVQLTVVTGAEANEVWANFDRVNNARATGSFRRGTMVSQDLNSRTWVINFRPSVWTTQVVEIGSNRTYNWPGAATQTFNLTLAQQFVHATPEIRSATPGPRNVNAGGRVTFSISTNPTVEHVWIRDVDNREFTAIRGTTTATARNWTLEFHPNRTGDVTVFANNTRTETGAARRTERITVGGTSWGYGDARIVGTPSAVNDGNGVMIEATTNRYAERVWATLPGGRRVELHRIGTGTGNRTWEVWATNVSSGTITVSATTQVSGTLNNLTADDTRNATRTTGTTGTGRIISGEHWSGSEVDTGDTIDFRIRTDRNVHDLFIEGTHVRSYSIVSGPTLRTNNEYEWRVRVRIRDDIGTSAYFVNYRFDVVAYRNNRYSDSYRLPSTRIFRTN